MEACSVEGNVLQDGNLPGDPSQGLPLFWGTVTGRKVEANAPCIKKENMPEDQEARETACQLIDAIYLWTR